MFKTIDSKLNHLDKAYIILNSQYTIDPNDHDRYFKSIEKLAELGQINAIQDFYKLKKDIYQNCIIDAIVKSNPIFGSMDFEESYALFLASPNKALAQKVVELANYELCKVFFNDKLQVAIVGERALEAFHMLATYGYSVANQEISNFRQITNEELNRLQESDFTKDQRLLLQYIIAKNGLRKNHASLPKLAVRKYISNLLKISQLPIMDSENV